MLARGTMTRNHKKCFSFPQMQLGCPNIKDLGFQGGDNLSEAIDLDDASLRFDCGYEILGSLQQSHPTRTGEDSRRLDCLVQGKILSVSESIFNHLETALKVLISVNCCLPTVFFLLFFVSS